MNLFESLRHTANRFGIDVCRVGRSRLGRILDLDLIDLSPEDGVIFDVGANTGRAARHFSKMFPASVIWSFEPGQEAFNLLSAAPDLSQVKKFKLALGDNEGTANLHTFRGSELNSLLPQALAADRHNANFIPKGSEQVQTTRLDTFCQQHQVSRIKILKIDTQGFELHVLRGAEALLNSGSINLIYLEINFVAIYEGQPKFSEIYDDFLNKFGFGFVGFYDVGRDSKGCVTHCDAIFKLNRDK